VAEDLPLVLMQQQQQQQQQQQGEAVPAAAGSSNAAAAAGTVLPAAKLAEHAQQVQQQQPQQELQQAKRRRLSDTGSSTSSKSTADVLDAAPDQQAAAAPNAASPAQGEHQQQADQQQQQQQQLGRKHKHGPAVEGCSYKGNLLDSSLLLLTPVGWTPEFLHSDADRVWRGGRIAPLGANVVLVLYGKEGRENEHSSSSSSGSGGGSVSLQEYRVRLVYNEQVLTMPGCSSSSSSSGLDCSLQEFLDVVVGDKISYERFKLLCDGGVAAEGWPSVDRLSSDEALSDLSSSSSSGSWGGLSVVAKGFQNSLQGLQLETADGLPLLLPAAIGDGRAAVWDD
jgi:hypothetical protein